MKIFGIITNKDKDIDFIYTRILVECIEKSGGIVKLSAPAAEAIGRTSGYTDDEMVLENCEMAICLGGDGTFLKAARKAYKKDIPLLGVNLGSLGFLTEIDKNDICSCVEEIMMDKFNIDERIMLEVSIVCNGSVFAEDIALNDIVISRGALSRILHVKTYINDVFVDSYPGDGLIISTPTGSTAYSLSAGGPIVEPDVDLMLVTPICPHKMYSRSIITTGDRVVKAVVDEKYYHNAMVTVDGQEGFELKGGDYIEVRKSSYKVKIIRLCQRNFFDVLRTKIYNRGECVRKNEI